MLVDRLNEILPKISSDDFLARSGIGNEIACYIFDYPPENETQVRDHIQFLLDHLPKKRPGICVKHVNLFEFVIDHLKERGLLDKALKKQRQEGDHALLKALKGTLHEEKLSKLFGEYVTPEETDLVLVSGVGSVYPMLRSHTLLNNLHAVLKDTPMVMFYPGKYDGKTLRLFGKTGISAGLIDSRRKEANYYRAFRLIT